MAITIYQETEQGNYVSVGSKGKTFVTQSDKGWFHGRIMLDADTIPTEGHPTYTTPQEALRAASADQGYKIEGKDTRQIGMALYSGR